MHLNVVSVDACTENNSTNEVATFSELLSWTELLSPNEQSYELLSPNEQHLSVTD